MNWKRAFAWIFFVSGIIGLIGIIILLVIIALLGVWHPLFYIWLSYPIFSIPHLIILWDYLKLTKE